MVTELLDQSWLANEFNHLKVEHHVREKVLELEYRLNGIFQELLRRTKWNISDFFTLAVAFHFVNDLLKGQYIDSQC